MPVFGIDSETDRKLNTLSALLDKKRQEIIHDALKYLLKREVMVCVDNLNRKTRVRAEH